MKFRLFKYFKFFFIKEIENLVKYVGTVAIADALQAVDLPVDRKEFIQTGFRAAVRGLRPEIRTYNGEVIDDTHYPAYFL